jgi:hypothetical protein
VNFSSGFSCEIAFSSAEYMDFIYPDSSASPQIFGAAFSRSVSNGKQIFLYFSNCPLPPGDYDPDQLERVGKIKNHYKNNKEILCEEYDDLNVFKMKFFYGLFKKVLEVCPESARYFFGDDVISAAQFFELRTSVKSKIERAEKSIFISGVTLKSVIGDAEIKAFKEKIKENGDFKIELLTTDMDPERAKEQSALYNEAPDDLLNINKEINPVHL